MSNSWFRFKQFAVHQDRCAMKVTTDACLFGAWVAKEIKNGIHVYNGTEPKKILDVGTGTGLLSLMIAQADPHSIIDGIEIDKDCFDQTKENIAASSWDDRINILHGDARTFPFNRQYEIIVSNPPFYENELQSGNKKKNIAHHGEGLLLEDLLKLIKTNLAVDGIFFLLLPYKRKQEIALLFENKVLSVFKTVLVKPSPAHNYSRMMIAGTKNVGIQPEETEIAISDNQQQYTHEFGELLKAYYLYL